MSGHFDPRLASVLILFRGLRHPDGCQQFLECWNCAQMNVRNGKALTSRLEGVSSGYIHKHKVS